MAIKAEQEKRSTWKEVLAKSAPLVLPAAHDALSARLIELAGFPAYQIGGFALVGSRFGNPDIDLTHFGENSAGVRDTMHASHLPVLVDADDGYGDVKNVTRTIQEYETMGASAIFLEDQRAPKRCGHMAGKQVISAETYVQKLKAALAARKNPDTFILSRTDARDPISIDEAIRRAELYHKTGADGVYVEALHSVDELEKAGKALKGIPLATTILEGGGKTPWLDPKELFQMGFSMLLYPSTLIFQVTHCLQQALSNLKDGKPMPPESSVPFNDYEDILGLPKWQAIEETYEHPAEGRRDNPEKP